MKTTTTAQQQNPPPPGWGWRCFRLFLRALRLLFILLLLSLAALVWHLHEIGLPEFVQHRIVAQFKAQGWDIDFVRVRWRALGLLVAEGIQLRLPPPGGQGEGPDSPQLFIEEARCEFHRSGLKNFHLELDSLAFSGGHVLCPLPATNRHSSVLVFNQLEGLLRARSDDAWELSFLEGSLLGVKVNLRGMVQHASSLRQWKLPKSPEKGPGKVRLDWGQILEYVREIHFSGRPELVVRFQADGAEVQNSKADIKFNVPRVHSPWGSGANFLLTLGLRASDLWSANAHVRDSNAILRANLHLTAEDTTSPWGQAKALRLQAEAEPTLAGPLGSNAQVRVELVEPIASFGKAKAMTATLQLSPVGTNSDLLQSQILLFADEAQTRWGKSQHAEVRASTLFHYSTTPSLRDLSGQAHINLKQVHSQYANAGQISMQTDWHWPEWQVEAKGNLYGGGLMLETALNTTNRELRYSLASDIDVQAFSSWLPTNAQRWLADYTNAFPPKLQAQGRLLLPGWKFTTNWGQQVLPTLSGAGHLDLSAGAYRGVGFLGVESSFTLTNMNLMLPRFKLSREEGTVEAEYRSDLRSSEFHWRLTSQLYPKVAQPFFEQQDAQRVFDEVVFTTPPWVQAELQGLWRQPERFLFQAQVRATNFTLRGESVKSFQGRIQYTNQVLSFIEPVVERTEGLGRAALAAVDFAAGKLYLTNGESRLDPYAITRAIGQEAVQAIAPYQFASPPQGQVNGIVDLKRNSDLNDLHFQVRGGPFTWEQFQLQQISGRVDWVGKTLTLSNVQADFQTGRLDGQAYFDFSPEKGNDCSFKANLIDVDLHELLSAWTSKTNHIEGRLNAELNITQANTALRNTWQGFGWLSLRNGLLWEIPMFGLFSPVLNAFVPGLGNSRARKATAIYMITNGVISTSDLEIHATAMRMQIQGAVGFDRQVEARVEAELLRDIPAIGLFVSKVFWPVTKLFEYKVSGPLGRPKAEPVYVLPKILMGAIHPIKSLKDLMGEERKTE